ncbi:hypothetical protein SAMN06265182_1831 [Persephonella hydrogeniphila]|uniref:Alginate export n=1 Tax=Persephonella hydrogeniphila TaxID=198703 RepID=A0A285NLG9_9AQUI|nr:hypothetical protein [Persephonella hydrogeniphila]SNZ10342.1 hypothetical protein SAMN06265182_1831 [Persephonella hydrogeniphila]
MMKGKVLSLGAAALLAGGAFLLSGQTNTANAQDLLGVSFIENVKPYLEFRPRYEYVDVDQSGNKEANALTIRTKVGVNIGTVLGVNGLSATLEAIDVSALVDDYAPQKSGYETVLDPDNTRITQAYLAYKFGNYVFVAGRKYVIVDDHRFIGTVGWRQMPQSLGVLAVAGKPVQGLDFLLAGVYERKFVVDRENLDWHLDKMPIVLDVNYQVVPQLRIKGFAYLLTDIHNTYGVKASGKVSLGNGINISYLGEYAKQEDPYENDNFDKKPSRDTDYYRLKVGASAMGFFGNVMYTYFGDAGGANKGGFSVPLATNHKFDGWADVLLKGAANGFKYGMKELCLSVGYKNKTIGKFMVAYLTFDADKSQTELGGSKDIGSEIDVLYTKKLTKRLSFLAKAAWYDADKGYVFTKYNGTNFTSVQYGRNDVTKYWLQLDYKY